MVYGKSHLCRCNSLRGARTIIKKVICSLIVLFVLSISSVQALSWAYVFVVWDGKVYEVKEAEILNESSLRKVIGEVETKPDEMTGSYYGNASNGYPIGTKYYAIEGVSTGQAIAVQNGPGFVKAVYAHNAPFHILNVILHPLFMSSFIVLLIVITKLKPRKIPSKLTEG